MPLSVVNSIASWILKKRIHQIELFMKYPQEVQNEVLFNLIEFAKDTEIGVRFDFKSIKTYEEFKHRIPICSYEEIAHLIERARKGEQDVFWPSSIKWFAKSSGTTNAKSKFIPVSTQSLEDCHYKSGKDLLSLYFHNNPESQLFSGKSLRLGGSKELYKENGTVFGDLSAILIDNAPFWAEMSSTPSNKVSLMSDWDQKMEAIIEETTFENVTSLAGVPSWMLVLLNKVIEQSGEDHLLELWKNLEVYFHGGVSFTPYRDQFNSLIPKSDFNYYEIYNASEGFFAIQDRNGASDLLLMLDYGIFYEFIPMDSYGTTNQRVVSLNEVMIGVNYALVITTNAGLWRYQIGDTVRFTSLNPYRIVVTGRTKHHINVFGEELIIENAEQALKIACQKTKAQLNDYTAAPIFMEEQKKGAHEWLIEFSRPPKSIDRFADVLDNALKALNSDYEAKRFNNMTLDPPVVTKARANLFHDWLATKNKLGGQHKIPRLSNTRDYIEELIALQKKKQD